MNRSAKFESASFILGEEIRHRTNKQVRPSSGTVVYPHMPILHARPRGPRHGCPALICALDSYGAGDARDSSGFGLLGEQSFPKWEIRCLGRQ